MRLIKWITNRKDIIQMELSQCREMIDKLNDEMLRLFIKRMDVAKDVAEYKMQNGLPILNKARERDILHDMTVKAGKEYESYVKVLYSVVMDLSRSYQSKLLNCKNDIAEGIKNALKTSVKTLPKNATVACQGVEGAYSQIAADKLFGIEKITYFKTFDEVFRAVKDGTCDYGVLPIENSTYGTVVEVYDLMKRYSFSIVSAKKVPIRHTLLACKGAELDGITEVVSHPQALGQCSEFLASHPNIKVTNAANTAISAETVARSGRKDIAAIASGACAELYDLDVLSLDIQNATVNTTRFICISKDQMILPGATKMSIMLTLPHTPGALYNTLARFTAEGLNLTKLESRPIAGTDFEAQLYFDFEASPYDDGVLSLLDTLSRDCESFSFLGAYPES